MVGDEKRLVLFHGLGQLLKVGLSELSRQEICPANASFTSASPLLPAAPITRTFIASSSCLVIWPPSKYATWQLEICANHWLQNNQWFITNAHK
jgi:hypothetical protein